jgi:hypothetical protein
MHKFRIALVATLLAQAAVSAVDSASAAITSDASYRLTGPSGGFFWLSDGTTLGGP